MVSSDAQARLKRLVGSLIFGAKHPLTVPEIRRVLVDVAEIHGGPARDFADIRDSDIEDILSQIREDCERQGTGFRLTEIARGYNFQSDPEFGLWVRHLLEVEKPTRLSRPALETLAIIAYRQPAVRSEIEGVRGVNVDHIVKLLLESQLIRIVGRSDLPGRPLMYGTTTVFLEHFGLKDVKQLPGIEELSRLELERRKKEKPEETAGGGEETVAPPEAGEEPVGESVGTGAAAGEDVGDAEGETSQTDSVEAPEPGRDAGAPESAD